MVYLMHCGLEPKQAFDIMETVRKKNKYLNDEMKEIMKSHNVPQWYIESCDKIQYMFPKAHAAAYIIASLRLAWFKIYYKLEYYCAYLTVRGGDVDAESMSKGKDAVKMLLKSIEAKVKEGTASNVEKDRQTIMMIVHEAMARGVEFLPIDIYKSTAHSYVPEDGKIRMPFSALPGVGEAAAEQLANARNDGGPEFSSIEEATKEIAYYAFMKKDSLSANIDTKNQTEFSAKADIHFEQKNITSNKKKNPIDELKNYVNK
jgi:DNA polymerase-3 subunit alpha (Gram-positive type)